MAKQSKDKLPFHKKNFKLMITGVVLLAIGFIIISLDNQPYGFGFLGITLGPIIVMSGFIVEFFAILSRPENE